MNTLQESYLGYLKDCLASQCKNTRSHIDRYKHCFANNRHTAGFSRSQKEITFALTIDKAEGAYLYDLDGNCYVDITCGFGVHLFGHSPSFIQDAINSQLKKGYSLGPLYSHASEVAQLICSMTSQERCAFFNTGTEAVMVATRLARAATGKNKIVIFEGAYHGTLDALLVMKQDPFSQKAIANIPGITNALVQDTYLLKFGEPASIVFISEHADEIAAVLTEPVQSRHPESVDPVFLEQLQGICKNNNIAFILDEIITGFRLCNGGAKKYFGLDPDIITYGKVLGGGFPIGVVAGRKKYLDYIDGGEWHFNDASEPSSPATFVAGTFCNHPLAMAASKATLEYLRDHTDSIQESLNEKTGRLCRYINEFCSKHHYPVKLVHFGSLFRFVISGKNRFIFQSLLKEKIYLWEGRTCFISTAHGEAEMELLEKGIKKCILEHAAAGLIKPGVNNSLTPATSHITCELRVDGELNPDLLALAFNYVMTNAETVMDKPITYFYNQDPDCSMEKQRSVELSARSCNNKTMLRLAVDRNLFDGWSITAILRALGRSYEAVSRAGLLPAEPFRDTALLRNNLGSKKQT